MGSLAYIGCAALTAVGAALAVVAAGSIGGYRLPAGVEHRDPAG